MRRKIYKKLLDWKNKSNGHTAVLIEGARRIGKSYIVEKFAKNEYKSYIIVDFNDMAEDLQDIFDHYLNKRDDFFMRLSLYYGVKLYERNSVIVFDEIQQYPKARAAIKYLVKDHRYDYIETGSLISIKRNVKDIVIPSEEEHLEMFPMDLEEFLWALGDDMFMDFIRDCYAKKTSLGSLHRKGMDYLRQYMVIGGMPQAVSEYVATKDFDSVDRVKRNIIRLYREDISKYAFEAETKVTRIFDEIPSQLQKHEKKFRLSALGSNVKMRDYEDAFFWLDDAKIINVCYNSTEPNIGLRLNTDRTTMKCYFCDTGLLISTAFDTETIQREQLYKKLILDKLEFNKGMLVENIVAQMFKANGHSLFFFTSSDKVAENRIEIDFLLSKKLLTNRHNIIPVEVKSTTRYTHVSLDKFSKKYPEYLDTPILFHTGDLKVENGILYLPLYMAAVV
ncbi:MAG: ATP-binding protein [Bacteroidales bacterium]|nr:ATP-binding protein [Bacteroidales bacterium]